MSDRGAADIEETPQSLLADPIEWFFAEHARHRQFSYLLDEAATSQVFDETLIKGLLDFVRNDMEIHVRDEEEDLFPTLRKRALPEDDIDRVVEYLTKEHKVDVARALSVAEHLESCLARRIAPGSDPAVVEALRKAASQEVRHLALENAVVLPIARLRLTPRDLRAMSRRLAARRGIVLNGAAA